LTPVAESWKMALRRRQDHFDLSDDSTCLRLLHSEDERLRCDRFGSVCWFYRYRTGQPTGAEQAQYDAFAASAGATHWHAHGMSDRGRDPQAREHVSSRGAPETWMARENGVQFELRANRGQSAGLFLDQRDNRAWVRQNSANARVLNLFAYTGAFGVSALLGEAAEAVQVDVSRPYLDWARVNATHNGVHDERSQYKAVDAQLLVDGCRKRGRRFDGIICDPPSFGRGRGRNSRVFQVQHDLVPLLQTCVALLDPGGWILVSTNYEGWTQAQFDGVLAGVGGQRETAPGAGADFRMGSAEPLLKSSILRSV
jgi:23S rRNA (cytosine1962-C5)-methyltransferase